MSRSCDCPCPKHDEMDDTDRWLEDMFPPESGPVADKLFEESYLKLPPMTEGIGRGPDNKDDAFRFFKVVPGGIMKS